MCTKTGRGGGYAVSADGGFLLKTKIDKIIHEELIPLQQTFRSWEQLANGSYRFDPKTFRKAVLKIQAVIDVARELTEAL